MSRALSSLHSRTGTTMVVPVLLPFPMNDDPFLVMASPSAEFTLAARTSEAEWD